MQNQIGHDAAEILRRLTDEAERALVRLQDLDRRLMKGNDPECELGEVARLRPLIIEARRVLAEYNAACAAC